MWDESYDIPAAQIWITRSLRFIAAVEMLLGLFAVFASVFVQQPFVIAAYGLGAIWTGGMFFLAVLVADCAIYLARTARRQYASPVGHTQGRPERGSVADLDAALRGDR